MHPCQGGARLLGGNMFNHWHHYSCSWSPVCDHNNHFEVAVVMGYSLIGGGGIVIH